MINTDIERTVYTCDQIDCGMVGKYSLNVLCLVCRHKNSVVSVDMTISPADTHEECPCCLFSVYDWELAVNPNCPHCGTQLGEPCESPLISVSKCAHVKERELNNPYLKHVYPRRA